MFLYISFNRLFVATLQHNNFRNNFKPLYRSFKYFLEKPDGSVRLAGSTLDYMGRVEVKHNGQWGTVCGFQWGRQDAEGLESKKVDERSF